MSSPPFNFVVALPAESKPLIAHFGLKRLQPDDGFPIYQKGGISLIRSGVGKAAAQKATRTLLNHQQQKGRIWINLGIAGHASRPIGDMILAQYIRDEASQQQWEIPARLDPPCELERLTTLSRPGFDYTRPGAFDMEAAGFLSALDGNGYCLKIISDNRHHPGHGMKAKWVSQLIRERLDKIEQFMHPFSNQR